MDPVDKFSTFNTQVPKPLAWFLKPKVEAPEGKDDQVKEETAKEEFKEWPKLFRTTLMERNHTD